MKTLRQTQLILQFVRSKGVQVRFHGRGKNEASHYCGQCEEEVFNMLFIKEQEKKHVVHCLHCSRRHSPNLEGFVCLEEYHLEDLIEVYDNFTLQPVRQVTNILVSLELYFSWCWLFISCSAADAANSATADTCSSYSIGDFVMTPARSLLATRGRIVHTVTLLVQPLFAKSLPHDSREFTRFFSSVLHRCDPNDVQNLSKKFKI